MCRLSPRDRTVLSVAVQRRQHLLGAVVEVDTLDGQVFAVLCCQAVRHPEPQRQAPILGNSALDRLANASYQIVIEGTSYRERLSPHRALLGAKGGD